MSLTKLSLGGNNDVIYKLFPLRESLVNVIPARDGNIEKPFLRCTHIYYACVLLSILGTVFSVQAARRRKEVCIDVYTIEYTEWQRYLSGLDSSMMEKFAQAGKVGSAKSLSPYLPSHTKLWCTLRLRGQKHSSCFYCTFI
jgi:hypothetical protein